MSEAHENTYDPVSFPGYLASDFLLWMWWASDVNGSHIQFSTLDEDDSDEDSENLVPLDETALDSLELWIGNKIALVSPHDSRTKATMSGEELAITPEVKVAIAQGKVISSIEMGLRIDDREYSFSLRTPDLRLHGVKLPTVYDTSKEEREGMVFERMRLLDELESALKALVQSFSHVRLHAWDDTLKDISKWLQT